MTRVPRSVPRFGWRVGATETGRHRAGDLHLCHHPPEHHSSSGANWILYHLISGCAKFESTNLNQHPRYPQYHESIMKYSWISYPLGQRAVLPDDMSIMSWKHWFVRCKASVYDSTYTLEVSCLAGCDSNLVNATQAQCHNVLDMLSTVKVSVTNCSSNSSNCSNVQRHSSNLHPIFIQSSWFAREDSGSRSAWRLNAIHRNLMLPAGPQRGQATSPNTKIIKNILKPRWCFISFMPFLCHFVIFIYFYVQLDFVVPSFKSLLGHIRVLRGQIEVTFHCECCTAAEWPWLVCQLGCLAIATRRSAACHAMRTAAMRSVEVCRSVSKCVEVCRSVKAKSTASVLTEMDLDRCMKALQIRADLDLDRGD